MKLKTLTQTFNDGVVDIYNVDNIALAGNKPKQGLTKKVGPLRYEERVVGMTRFWTAKQSNAKVQQILRTPRVANVNIDDIAVPNDGTQYRILQVQYPPNVEPPVMDLSLEKLEVIYDIRRN